MKNFFTKNIFASQLLFATSCITGLLFSSALHAQTYYSQFTSPVNNYDYAVTNPNCTGAPTIQNAVGVADNYGANDNDNTFAYFLITNLVAPYSCVTDPSGERYKFNVNLNIPDNGSLPAGADVGFKIRVPTGISRSDLGNYLVIGTNLLDAQHNVTFQEYADPTILRGKALDQNGDNKTWIVHFTTTKSMNDLELSIDPNIGLLNSNFEFDVYYGYGIDDATLPAQLTNFKATVSGKSVNLSWQSLTETNVKGYRIERSNNGGSTYTSVAMVIAKGNGNAAINYAYSDNSVVDGSYLYRVVIIDKSGSFKNSNAVNAIIKGQGKLLLYPTIIKAGQNITVKTSETGNVTVHIFDATGRLVKQQRVASSGQFSIATAGLTTGIYTVKLVTQSGNVSQSKIMVN